MRSLPVLCMIIALGVAVTTNAAVPRTLSYQGVLKDSGGNIVPDGDYTVTFRIYDVDSAGTALWTQTQTLPVVDGILNAILGKPLGIDLPFDTAYFLGVEVGTEGELEPRLELTSAPYAHRAAIADSALNCVGGPDSDWSYSGDNIYRLSGTVGIGRDDPDAKLDVLSADGLPAIKARATGTDWQVAITAEGPPVGGIGLEGYGGYSGLTGHGTGSGENYGVRGESYNHIGVYGTVLDYTDTSYAVYGYDPSINGGHGVYGNAAGSFGVNYGVYGITSSPSGYGVYGSNPDGYAGYFAGKAGVSGDFDVGGTTQTLGFRLTDSPSSGYVLTSDASGNGTWQPSGAGSLTLPYSGVVSSGGTAFSVTNIGAGQAGVFTLSGGLSSNSALLGSTDGTGAGVEGYNWAGYTGWLGAFGAGVRGYSQYGYGVWGQADYGAAVYGSCGMGHGVRGESQDSMGVWGSGGTYGVYGQSQNGAGVYGLNMGSGNFGELGNSQAGVYAQSGVNGNFGFMGWASSGVRGVTQNNAGVEGWATGTGKGVSAYSDGGLGVYAYSQHYIGVWAEGRGCAVHAECADSTGVHASGGTVGVDAGSDWGTGVQGTNEHTGNYGLLGTLDYGVYGFSPNVSGGNYGALGTSGMGVYARGYQGVYGIGTTDGVHGYGEGESAKGTYGEHGTSGNYGYLGDASYGVYGKHNASGNEGYIGSSSYGIYGRSTSGYAGYFSGKAKITTTLEVGQMARMTGVSWPASGKSMELCYDPGLHKGYIHVYDRDTATWGDLYLGDGRVGIGTGTPARALHIKDVMRLEPRANYPSSPSDGDLCVVGASGSRHIYCYLNGAWKQLD
jgi:hypothetical protein